MKIPEELHETAWAGAAAASTGPAAIPVTAAASTAIFAFDTCRLPEISPLPEGRCVFGMDIFLRDQAGKVTYS
ncbi:hypothetical protein GCM10023096_24370 [Nonomuraea ferruginea]